MNFYLIYIYALNIPYYYNPNIHNFGNIGFFGKIHANVANQATKIIDNLRYNGKNIRSIIYKPYLNNNKTILDLCCGVGISTAPGQTGIDTSIEMLKVARKNNKKSKTNTQFYFGNAENFKPKIKPDIVTCMFAFHEMPQQAQIRVINNGIMIAKEEFIIVDIAPNYKNKNPPKIMLSGEPYLLDYLHNIENLLYDFEETIYIPKHVHVWKYKK
jgi:SAM-dependent methyltransferase